MENNRHIVVYGDQGALTADSGIRMQMEKSFPGYSTARCNTAQFLAALRARTASVMIIPGIEGDTCRYTDLIGSDEALRDMEAYVADGGLLITICAGSYFVSRKTTWTPEWGAPKSRSNLRALFNGVAWGPVGSVSRAIRNPEAARPQETISYHDCTMVPISYQDKQGHWKNTQIAYANGPALTPDVDETDIEVLARYQHVADSPIAAAWKNIGRGAVLWLGILPYVAYDPAVQEKEFPVLMRQLKENDAGQKDFWASLAARIDHHLAFNRQAPSPWLPELMP